MAIRRETLQDVPDALTVSDATEPTIDNDIEIVGEQPLIGRRQMLAVILIGFLVVALVAVLAFAPRADGDSRREAPLFALDSVTNPSESVALPSGLPTLVAFVASWTDSGQLLVDVDSVAATSGVRVVGVIVRNEPGDALNMLSSTGVDIAVGSDPSGTVADRYDVRSIPSVVAVDADGRIAGTLTGNVSRDDIVGMANEIKAQSPVESSSD